MLKLLLLAAFLPLMGIVPGVSTGETSAALDSHPLLQAYGFAQDAPPAGTTLPSDTRNPVKPTVESRLRAKKLYGYECSMCHGDSGDGKTDLARDMKMTLTDLTDPKTLADKTDADLYNLIKNGKGQMSPEGDRVKPDEAWNLVIYVRAMAKGK